jgi:zinc transporter, ZIP family
VSNVGPLVGWGAVIAAGVVAGAVTAATLRLPARVAALVSSFAGGVLLAAVAFELVPDAEERAGLWLTALGLLAGTLIYVGADIWLSRNEEMGVIRRLGHAAAAGRPAQMPPGRTAAHGQAIAAGLIVDGVPESIALGLTVAEGEVGVALLAGILVGNTVEAYGAAQPIIAGGRSKRFALALLAAIGAALGVATVLGGALLSEGSEALVGSGEAIAAGALLAVISISIVPYAFSEVSSLVATATVLGFVGGYLLS